MSRGRVLTETCFSEHSIQKEPACFAFLGASAVSPPVSIKSFLFEIESADFVRGRASVWATLSMRTETEPGLPLLGFDEVFPRPFMRALLGVTTTNSPYRMSIAESGYCRVVEYLTQGAQTARLKELMLTPYDRVIIVSGVRGVENKQEDLFHFPRTDSFLRSFGQMVQKVDTALHGVIAQSERIARERQ